MTYRRTRLMDSIWVARLSLPSSAELCFNYTQQLDLNKSHLVLKIKPQISKEEKITLILYARPPKSLGK
jgi:hypothetical protein